MTDRARPYPWHQCARVQRAEALFLSKVARVMGQIDTRACEQIISSMLGCQIAVGAPVVRSQRLHDANAVAVEIGGSVPFTLALPGAFAAWAVDRALGDDVELERVDAGLSPRDEMSLGVVAYVAARLVQSLPGAFHVNDVHPTIPKAPGSDDASLCVEIPLSINHHPVQLRAWTSEPELMANIIDQTPRNPLLMRSLLRERCVLSAQLLAPLTLPASALRLDDVRILSAPGVRFTPQGIVGTVQLRILGARQQMWHGTLQGNRIELEERVTMKDDAITTASRETTIATSQAANDLTPIADAPLELSVEIARFTLPLGELAALCRGEILVAAKPVGQHVTLRAGTRAIATGELVDVDGSIGVRILDVLA